MHQPSQPRRVCLKASRFLKRFNSLLPATACDPFSYAYKNNLSQGRNMLCVFFALVLCWHFNMFLVLVFIHTGAGKKWLKKRTVCIRICEATFFSCVLLLCQCHCTDLVCPTTDSEGQLPEKKSFAIPQKTYPTILCLQVQTFNVAP